MLCFIDFELSIGKSSLTVFCVVETDLYEPFHVMADQQQPQPGMQAMQYRFILEHPGSTAPDSTRPRNPEQREAMRATNAVGGACVFCQLRKKGCNSPRPCNECLKNLLPCMKDTSLCLAVPTRKGPNFWLRGEIFPRAQNTLNNFRSVYTEDLLEGNGTVSVQWGVSGEMIPSTWSEGLDRLHCDKIDDTVRNPLIDIALKSVSIPQLEQTGPLEPLYDDPLYKDAYDIIKLFAAIETISRSLLTIQPMHMFHSRFVIFLMLTVYAMKICEISMSFVSRLDSATEDNRLGEEQVQWAVEIYSRLIKRLASFEKPDSFLSDLFCQIQQPQLDGIQASLDKILSTSHREQSIVFPTLSEVEPFQITIRITSNRTPAWAPAMVSYGVDRLLHRDFKLPPDTGATDPGLHTDGDTFNPRVLTVNPRVLYINPPAFEGSSTRMTTTDADNVFSAPGDSQETDATSMNWHEAVSSIYLEHNTSWTMSDAQDWLAIGDHLS